jgi:Protein kinase domain/Ankyrin repeats (3 copies)
MWKLTDFGFASVVASAAVTSLYGRGSPGYRAPELLLNWDHRQYSSRSDIWSLGCILHEMATGQRIFENDFYTERVYRAAQPPPLSLQSSYERGVWPDQLSECISNLLAKDLRSRPDAISASKKLAAYGTILGIPAVALLTDVPLHVGWNNLSETTPFDMLFSSLIKAVLAEGPDYTDTRFVNVIAQDLDQEFSMRATEQSESESIIGQFWVKNDALLRLVGETLTAKHDYEDAYRVFAWLLSQNRGGVHLDLMRAIETGDNFLVASLVHRQLFEAARVGNAKVVEALLQYGSNVYMGQGPTALHYAAIGGNTKVVEILVGHCEVKVDVQDHEGIVY